MKKHLTIRVVLISIALIFIAFIAIQVFDAGHWAKADSPKLERLFEDMGVLELPQTTDPVEIRLQDINGNLVSLSDFRGRIVFLNFWTTWCPTCRVEMPSMEKLHRKFKDQDFWHMWPPSGVWPWSYFQGFLHLSLKQPTAWPVARRATGT